MLKGFMNKCAQRQQAEEDFFLSIRVREKLTEKTSWLKSKKKREEIGSMKMGYRKGGKSRQQANFLILTHNSW